MYDEQTHWGGAYLCEEAGSHVPAFRQEATGKKVAREPRRARTLDDSQIERVLAHVAVTSNSPASDELKVLLSFYAGLRVSEIAGLTLAAVLDADDKIAPKIVIGRHIAKNGRPRIIPMHPRIRAALVRFRAEHPGLEFLAFSNRGKIRRQNGVALGRWFSRLYRDVGLNGCSSHSGRRTFITRMARMANLYGNSLRDVQLLAGHARMETTADYIDPADDLGRLVRAFSAAPPNSKSMSNHASKGEYA